MGIGCKSEDCERTAYEMIHEYCENTTFCMQLIF